MKNPQKLKWDSQKRPICLLNAIKYHPNDRALTDFVIEKMEKVKKRFIFDSVMREIIRNDWADIARRIINNRWWDITKDDEIQAQLIGGKCHQFFVERSQAISMNEADRKNQNEDVIDLDDEEWEKLIMILMKEMMIGKMPQTLSE